MAFGKLTQLYSKGLSKGLNKTGPSPIAIDFGSSSLKVLQITNNEPPVLMCAGQVQTPGNLIENIARRLDFQIAALPGLIKSLSVKGRRAVCAIPSPLTFCKNMQLPKQDGLAPEILADTMLTEQVGRDATTMVRKLIKVESSGTAPANSQRNEYICLASGNEVIEKLMAALRSAKLEVVGMHSEFESILQAFAYINKRQSDAETSTLYLDIGCTQSCVVIGHGTKMVFARNMNFGGLSLDSALAREANITIDNARQRRLAMDDLVPIHTPQRTPAVHAAKPTTGDEVSSTTMVAQERRAGLPAPGTSSPLDTLEEASVAPMGASLAEPLEICTDEINMCIRHHDAMFKHQPVESIVFVGGEARHRGLCQHIARTLRLPARVADPMARFVRDGSEHIDSIDITSPQPGWTVAAGLCQAPTDL